MFGTAVSPPSDEPDPLRLIGAHTGRAESQGLDGLLFFYSHKTFDPWVTAGAVLHNSKTLTPIVALQPYAHSPFTVAKMIYSLVRLHKRRIDVNLITGAAREELDQVGDSLSHDERYDRATEYVRILRQLLSEDQPVTHEGQYYRYRKLRTHTKLDPEMLPRIFVAGSSSSGKRAADAIGDVSVTHPEPVRQFSETFLGSAGTRPKIGIRIGILARESRDEAWAVAHARYRSNRAAELQTTLKKRSESDWSRRLAHLSSRGGVHDEVYWTGAFHSGKGSMPLLVGGHGEVADYLERYLSLGVDTIILGGPLDEGEFRTTSRVIADLRNR
ncbi:LLM class flavin-dependent oxidoreductase [Streptomyces sp. NPDC012623]|uniref:LLM class flavin-dependent oxidoreductase n=1 Tax=unclassified Streptomyces TaxID=2593676 RepID=UPI00367EE4CA